MRGGKGITVSISPVCGNQSTPKTTLFVRQTYVVFIHQSGFIYGHSTCAQYCVQPCCIAKHFQPTWLYLWLLPTVKETYVREQAHSMLKMQWFILTSSIFGLSSWSRLCRSRSCCIFSSSPGRILGILLLSLSVIQAGQGGGEKWRDLI